MLIATSVHGFRIDCTFYRDDPDLLNQIGLSVLVAIKFRGVIDAESYSRNPVGDGDGLMLSIQFKDYDSTDQARSWFGRNLVNGKVDQRYIGAIPRADPSLRETRLIHAELMKLPKFRQPRF